jgi:hypothetical protein
LSLKHTRFSSSCLSASHCLTTPKIFLPHILTEHIDPTHIPKKTPKMSLPTYTITGQPIAPGIATTSGLNLLQIDTTGTITKSGIVPGSLSDTNSQVPATSLRNVSRTLFDVWASVADGYKGNAPASAQLVTNFSTTADSASMCPLPFNLTGSGLNTTTGAMTVPFAGEYEHTLQLRASGGQGSLGIFLSRNSSTAASSFLCGHNKIVLVDGGYPDYFSITRTIRHAAGDVIQPCLMCTSTDSFLSIEVVWSVKLVRRGTDNTAVTST